MYIALVVLMTREAQEPEANEFDLEPGTPRDARMVEEELERLLAPHSGSTWLVVRNVRDDLWEKRVPNYGAEFDSWDLDETLSEQTSPRCLRLGTGLKMTGRGISNGGFRLPDIESCCPGGRAARPVVVPLGTAQQKKPGRVQRHPFWLPLPYKNPAIIR